MQSQVLTNPLDSFLQQPDIEASPAWEFIQGQARQKPMQTLFHSRLQRNLVNTINQQTTAYEAIQELRCYVRFAKQNSALFEPRHSTRLAYRYSATANLGLGKARFANDICRFGFATYP